MGQNNNIKRDGEQAGVSGEDSNETDKGENVREGLAFATLRPSGVLQRLYSAHQSVVQQKIPVSHVCLFSFCAGPLIPTINSYRVQQSILSTAPEYHNLMIFCSAGQFYPRQAYTKRKVPFAAIAAEPTSKFDSCSHPSHESMSLEATVPFEPNLRSDRKNRISGSPLWLCVAFV